MDFTIEQLPAVNATLNALAAVLLVLGWAQIKLRRERAHKMLDALGVRGFDRVSGLLPGLSLSQVGSVQFQGPPAVRPVYLPILMTPRACWRPRCRFWRASRFIWDLRTGGKNIVNLPVGLFRYGFMYP